MKKILLLPLILSLLFAPGALAKESRIVGGTPASEGAWPAQTLLRSGGLMCGGTLIHPRWVLSAAHCFYGAEDEPTTAAIGSTDYFGAPEQTVSDIYTHKGFSETYDNDIALLRLANPSGQTPSALARPGEVPTGGQGYIAGWGTTCYQSCSPSRTLLQATAEVRSYELCSSIYTASGYPYSPNMICAGGGPNTSDACQGDSGGPLMADGASGRILIGIVSWGIGCAMEEYPGVYTNVSNYNNWIGALVADRVRAPRAVRISKSSNIKIQNQSSLQLAASLQLKTKGPFRIQRNGCKAVSYGQTCTVRVRKTARGKGKLLVQSRAGIKLATVGLRG